MNGATLPEKKVILFYPYRNLSTNPSMIALIEELSQLFELHVIIPEGGSGGYPELSTKSQLFLEPNDDRLDWNRPLPQPVTPTLTSRLRTNAKRFVPQTWLHYLRSQRKSQKPNKPIHAIIGIDPTGIAAARAFQKRTQAPLIYLSFEILYKDELTYDVELKLKAAEEEAVQNCDFVIIQDDLRAHHFSNNIDSGNISFEFLPVAPKPQPIHKSNYLHSHLNLPTEMKIVLFQGSLANWCGRYEWESMVASWPNDTVLVIHSRSQLDKRTKKYFNRMTQNKRVFITDTPLTNEQLPMLTASADIGLATYHPSPDSWYDLDNLKNLGLASGKLSYYLMCGLPILTDLRTSLGKLVAEKNIGRAFALPHESGESIKQILSTHHVLSTNASEFYRNHLAPTNFIPQITARIEALRKI
jgi:hypothetical protein